MAGGRVLGLHPEDRGVEILELAQGMDSISDDYDDDDETVGSGMVMDYG